MMRINLLPWREARRKAQRRQLAIIAGGVALIGVGPGRDQVIWTETGRASLAARTPAAA